MDPFMKFTTEELIVLLHTAGHKEEARTLAAGADIVLDTEILSHVFLSTIIQLTAKGIWDKNAFEEDHNPLSREMISFLEMYTKSDYFIRAIDESRKQVMFLHHIAYGVWLLQLVEDKVIHDFSFLEPDEIPHALSGFYAGFTPAASTLFPPFRLDDASFEQLRDPKQHGTVIGAFGGTLDEKEAFLAFVSDLERNSCRMENISVFSNTDKAPMTLEDIVFLLPSDKGIWTVRYDQDQSLPVTIRLADGRDWKELLHEMQNSIFALLAV